VWSSVIAITMCYLLFLCNDEIRRRVMNSIQACCNSDSVLTK